MKIFCRLSHGNETAFLAAATKSPEPSFSSIAWGSWKVSWRVRLGLDSAISWVGGSYMVKW